MTTEAQKSSELVHLEKAFRLLGITDYSIIDKENESPDFLVEILGKIIGVEVTCLYRDLDKGNSAKVQSDLPKIVEDTINFYNKKNGFPFVFAFGFDGKLAINNTRNEIAKKLGNFLYEYTKRHFPYGTNQYQDIVFRHADREIFPFLNFIMVQPTDKPKSLGFLVSGFNSMPASESILEETIRKKEVLIPKYMERCSEIWLLLTLPSMNLAADYALTEEGIIKISNQFDAAYVFDEYMDKIQTITTA